MRYAIIGAGLAGLTAAYEIRTLDPQATIDVFEATDRIGGKLRTVAFQDGPTDMGAEAFLAYRKDAVDFFTELGLGERIATPSGLTSLIYAQGKLYPMPHATMMGVPAESAALGDLAVSPAPVQHRRSPTQDAPRRVPRTFPGSACGSSCRDRRPG